MKKLILVLIILMIGFLLIPETYAYSVPIDASERFDQGYTLGYESYPGGTTYYVVSGRTEIDSDYIDLEIVTDSTSDPLTWMDTHTDPLFVRGAYSRLRIYETALSETPVYSRMFSYETEEATGILFWMDSEGVELNDVKIYSGYYIEFGFQLFDGITASQANQLTQVMTDSFTTYFDMTYSTYNDDEEVVETIEDLPLTTGTPFTDTGSYPDLTSWEYDALAAEFSFIFSYFGTYRPVLEGLTFTDDSFLEGVDHAYYFTDENDERFIIFYYDADSGFSLTDTEVLSKSWSQFSIWNMTTGEVVVNQKAFVLTYLDIEEENRDIYAYMYMPDVVMDNLMSVSLTMFYRYGVNNLTTFWRQTWEDWQSVSMILEAGETTLSEYPTWVNDMYTASAATIAVGSILLMIPVTQVVAIPVLLTGGVLLNLANAGAIDHLMTGAIEQLVEVSSPSATLLGTIEDHYEVLAGETVTIGEDEKLHRLYLGRYNQSGTNQVEVATSLTPEVEEFQRFRYTEIVWVTEGEIYSVTEPYIETESIMDALWVDSLDDADPTLSDTVSSIMMMVLAGGVIVVAVKGDLLKGDSGSKIVILIAFVVIVLLLL